MADQDNEAGQFREKLIRRKQEWAAEGRLLTGRTSRPEAERLPPGQREVKNWPVLDLGAQSPTRNSC
jgi:DMSO/TMAO reductase YedYZ molybdopterin-dependent catalytic subunit